MLLEQVWGYHFDPQTNVIDVHISRLRQKIDRDYDVAMLHTLRGVGYALRPAKRMTRAKSHFRDGDRSGCAGRASTVPIDGLSFSLLYLCLFTTAVLVLAAFLYWAVSDSAIRQVDRTIDAEIRGLAEQYRQRGTNGLDRGGAPAFGLGVGNAGTLSGDRSELSVAWPAISRAGPTESPDPQGWVTFRLGFPESEGGGINFGRARTHSNWMAGCTYLVGHDVRERSRIATMVRESLGVGTCRHRRDLP